MKSKIVLHHSVIPKIVQQQDRIIYEHAKKFGQKGAYHYLVNKDGGVYQFHDENFTGYHAGNWLVNVDSIGICVGGDLTKEELTAAQVEALTALVTDIQKRRGIPDSEIYLHREVRATACPAIDLRAVVRDNYDSYLLKRMKNAENALNRVSPERRGRLQRFIARVKELLGVEG